MSVFDQKVIIFDLQGLQNSSKNRGVGQVTTNLATYLINKKNKIKFIYSDLFDLNIKKNSQLLNYELIKFTYNKKISVQKNQSLYEKKINSINGDVYFVTSYLDCLRDGTISVDPLKIKKKKSYFFMMQYQCMINNFISKIHCLKKNT